MNLAVTVAVTHRAQFIPHTGSVMSNTDRLADLLADGLSVIEAADRLGVSHAYANAMLQRIRKGLGSQAC